MVARALNGVASEAWAHRAMRQFPICAGRICDDDLVGDDVTLIGGDGTLQGAHPRVLLAAMLGEDRFAKALGKGAYGTVYEVRLANLVTVPAHEMPHPSQFQICVKQTEILNADEWGGILERIQNTQCLDILHQSVSPQSNDAVAEPILAHMANAKGWFTDFSLPVLGTLAEDPQCVLHMNRDPSEPPLMYVWSPLMSGEVDWECREAMLPAESVLELEAVVAQALAGVVSLCDAGVTHNDLHVGNLVYSKSRRRRMRYISAQMPLEGQCAVDACDDSIRDECLFDGCLTKCHHATASSDRVRLPVYEGRRVHAIDFGLAHAVGLGGTTMRELNMRPDRGVDMDVRTLALDIYTRAQRAARALLRHPETAAARGEPPEVSRARSFVRDFLHMALVANNSREISSTDRLFQHPGHLRRAAKKCGVVVKDHNKTMRNLSGKYHIIREMLFQPSTDPNWPTITRRDVVELLRRHYLTN